MRTTLVPSLVAALVLACAGTTRAQVVAVCGDGAVQAPELCDDGNLVDGDGCDSNCTPTGCGNGVVTAGEQCDDGNLVSGDCCSATCVNENLPPDCSGAFASVDELWPPNHKLVPVTIGGVVDPDGDPLVLTVTAIAQDEPLDATGDGATCPDATGVGLDAVSLRSERSGHGDGRVYHVAFQAVDRCNAVCTSDVTVAVRHDRSPHKGVGDGGPLYDSTAGAPPCTGDSCEPVDCVPDPGQVDGCESDSMPRSVAARLDRARSLLDRAAHGKGRRLGRQAGKQLAKAAKRAERAGDDGTLSDTCATALSAALEGGANCAACSGAE
jgi:cysteine-rich repeat protein